jgi:hypothetical protein
MFNGRGGVQGALWIFNFSLVHAVTGAMKP